MRQRGQWGVTPLKDPWNTAVVLVFNVLNLFPGISHLCSVPSDTFKPLTANGESTTLLQRRGTDAKHNSPCSDFLQKIRTSSHKICEVPLGFTPGTGADPPFLNPCASQAGKGWTYLWQTPCKRQHQLLHTHCHRLTRGADPPGSP